MATGFQLAFFFIRVKREQEKKKQSIQWEIVQKTNVLCTVKQIKRNAQSCSVEVREKPRYIIVVI